MDPAGKRAARDGSMTFDYRRGKAPLLTIFGGDVTTSRLRAERAVSKLTPFYPMSPRWTAKAPLPGGDFAWARFDDEVDRARERWRFLTEAQAQRLVAAYGTRVEAVLGDAKSRADLGPAFGAELTGAGGALSHDQRMGALSGRHSVAALQAGPDHAAAGSRGAGGVHGGAGLSLRRPKWLSNRQWRASICSGILTGFQRAWSNENKGLGGCFVSSRFPLQGKRSYSIAIVLIGLIVSLGFSGVFGAILWDMARRDRAKALDAATNLVATIANDISRNIDLYDLSLQAVVDGLKLPEVDQLSPQLRHMILFDRAATAKDLGSILVIDSAGQVTTDSRFATPPAVNYAQRDFFQIHQRAFQRRPVYQPAVDCFHRRVSR